MSKIVVGAIERTDGTSYSTTLFPEKSASGSSTVVFNGIPDDIKGIKVMMSGVSLNQLNNFRVQLGNSTTWITSGYFSICTSGTGVNDDFSNQSFVLSPKLVSDTFSGQMIISKLDFKTWVQSGAFVRSQTGNSATAGDVVLPESDTTVTRIRVACNGGSSFDSGRISVSYTL